jgi:hypothetical protein
MIGGSIMLSCSQGTSARRDDVLGQVCAKGHITIQKGVGGHEGIKVKTRKDGDLPPRTVEVGGDGILCLTTFVICNIDITKGD